jgi:hypothetical protein
MINKSFNELLQYCATGKYKGYDPYDTLNSPLLNHLPGKIIPSVFIQIQKRIPVNLRPLLGIRKEINPKAIGLFLKTYTLLYKRTNDPFFLEKATEMFNWLSDHYTKGFSGHAWGYNFDWASPGNYLKAYTPSVVVTSFVIDGIFEYHLMTKDEKAKEMIMSASAYILKDIPILSFPEGISFAYTHLSKGACYNASLLAAEILAKNCYLQNKNDNTELIRKAVSFVLSRQKEDGSWNYSLNTKTGKERVQIDFHQGFILVSLYNILKLTGLQVNEINWALERGLLFYRNNQFNDKGRSYWRLPKKWPVDIHNQSQGIITFSRLKDYHPDAKPFAGIIADWTIRNMQHQSGYFYYRKYPYFTNKIPFIRWSQAWMLLALTELMSDEK